MYDVENQILIQTEAQLHVACQCGNVRKKNSKFTVTFWNGNVYLTLDKDFSEYNVFFPLWSITIACDTF